MEKPMKKGRTTYRGSSKYYSTARALTIIGAVCIIIGSIWGLTMAVPTWQSILIALGMIFINLLILDATGVVNIRIHIPYKWIWLLVLVIIQALLAGYGHFTVMSLTGLGLLLEIVAIIILLL